MRGSIVAGVCMLILELPALPNPLPVALEDPVPLPPHDGPISISVGVYVDDFAGLSMESNTFKLDFWFNLYWVDTRNNFTAALGVDPAEPKAVALGMQAREKVWLPDVTITNSEQFEVLLSKLQVYPNGTTTWMRRIAGDFEADLDYQQFPFESHELTLKFESKDYFANIIELQPWYTMVGMKDESKSIGKYNWKLNVRGAPRDHCDIARDDSICADSSCMIECKNSASTEPEKLVVRQLRKSAFSGAPKGSVLASSRFQKYRITVSLAISRKLGNTVVKYFAPSVLLIVISALSFCAKTNDLGTRLAASLVGLLTFEVMADRMFGMIPPSEEIMWATVWHVFHVGMLGGIVVENGMATYLAMCVYDSAGNSLDKASIWVFGIAYSITLLVLAVMSSSSVKFDLVFVIFVAAGVGCYLVVYGFLVKRVTDLAIVVRLVGETHIGRGPFNMWEMIRKFVVWRNRSAKNRKQRRCLRRSCSHIGFGLVSPNLPDDVLERFAYERIARKANYYDDPMSAELSEMEFTRAVWKTFGQIIQTGQSGSSEELTKAVNAVLRGHSVAYDPPTEKSDVVTFKKAGLLKKCFSHCFRTDVNDADVRNSDPTSPV